MAPSIIGKVKAFNVGTVGGRIHLCKNYSLDFKPLFFPERFMQKMISFREVFIVRVAVHHWPTVKISARFPLTIGRTKNVLITDIV
jgi:hypothetical protein